MYPEERVWETRLGTSFKVLFSRGKCLEKVELKVTTSVFTVVLEEVFRMG